MIDDARYETIKREALECRAILSCAIDNDVVDKFSAKNLIDKYENGLNQEEVDLFREVLTYGDLEPEAEFGKFILDVYDVFPPDA